MGKYRAQILLEPEQHETLQKIAEREGRSLSDVAREVIQIGLEVRESDDDIIWQKRQKSLERLNRIREEIREQHGIYEGNLIAEVRSERERQINRVWKQNSQ